MDWTNPPATEKQPESGDRLAQNSSPTAFAPPVQPGLPGASPPSALPPAKASELKVDKVLAFSSTGGQETRPEIFTLTLGGETIELLPLKTWNQLDHFKWTARGKLPAEPTGLEIAHDHVRLAGETVPLNDPAACLKLERLFNEWLFLEKETLKLAREKARPQPRPPTAQPASARQSQTVHFRVEVDKRGLVHIHCQQGKDTLASIGLTVAGFTSLIHQGLMRKPHLLTAGALHDWVQLDGELCSFEKGRNDSARLEQLLNERYAPEAAVGLGKEVVVFLNPASSTGFDIQFPVTVAGVPDNHRHHLNEQSLALLQDRDRCGLLHRDIIVKLTPPNLIFKQKTPDGGEQYLTPRPENTLTLPEDEGRQKSLDLSQPINLLHLAPAELTAVFNHPFINRHTKAAPGAPASTGPAPDASARGAASLPPREKAGEGRSGSDPAPPQPPAPAASVATQNPEIKHSAPSLETQNSKPDAPPPLPNLWLSDLLAQPQLQPGWFACLAYRQMAEHFGDSSEGSFGPAPCWFISLGEAGDIEDPAFKGLFLTEKHSLGFLGAGQVARFYNGVAFLGPRRDALEAIQVKLLAVGLDAHERLVFIVNDNYRARFDVPETTLAGVLKGLSEAGTVILSAKEILASREPLQLVWTVPAEQSDPSDPQALESTPPALTA